MPDRIHLETTTVHIANLEYSDGKVMYESYVAYKKASDVRRPCVLLLHAWAGLCDHERRLTRELAQLGYVAVAVDLYGKHVRGDPLGDNSLHGYEDPFAPPASLQAIAEELLARRADWQLHVFGGVKHAFTFPEAAQPERSIVYDAVAAGRSWVVMKNFLAEVLVTPRRAVFLKENQL